MSPELKRRFKIGGICLLIVFALASTVFVVRVASRPSEPFLSVKLVRTNLLVGGSVWTNKEAITIELSNRMSFTVNYWVESWNSPMESQRRIDNHNFSSSLFPHSQSREFVNPSDKAKIRVSYERQLKSFEVSFLNRLPWLKQHYPFQSRRTNIYEWKGTNK